MNPIIIPPAMGKQQDRLGSSALARQLVQEKENCEFKPVELRLKIDLVSYPARAEGLVNRIGVDLKNRLPVIKFNRYQRVWFQEVPVVQSLSSQEMDTATRVQILDLTDCISHSTNTLGKGMNPIILPPTMGKQQDRPGSSVMVRQLVQEKENSEIKPVKLRLKIDRVSYPARAEGLGKQYQRVWFGWDGFYGISILMGYLMPNALYTNILNIYDLV